MESFSNASWPVKLVLLVVLLPLALGAAGFWQFTRLGEDADLLEKIGHSIVVLESIQKEAGNPHVTIKTRKGKVVAASEILRNNKAYRERLLNETWWQRNVCLPLSVAAMAFGALGAITGLYGLVTVRRAGTKALRSREALLRGFQEGLVRLPWLIGAIGMFISLALACCVSFELVNFISEGARGRGAAKLAVLGISVVALLLFFSAKLVRNIYTVSEAVFERDPMRLMGKSVTKDEAPLVWQFVKSVADRAGATMPDAIILGLDEGFFVTEHPVALMSGQAVPEGRVLYLPLPYMAYMTKAEAEAVIGHELGHFTGADTEYSLRFSPIYATAVNNLRAVDAAADDGSGFMGLVARPALLFGIYYLDSFDLAVQHWSREREFAADAMGARIAGNEAIALSLLRISVLAPHVYQALGECWAKGGRLEGGVLNRVRELVREHGLGDPAEHLEDTQAHPTDSHPATSRRLAAVNVPVTPELLARACSVDESPLLRELGLESDAEPEPAFALSQGLPSSKAGLGLALEAEFSQAARENAEGMEKDLRVLASLGTDTVEFYEDAKWGKKGIAIGLGMFLIGVIAAQKSLPAGIGGMVMGALGIWMYFHFRKRAKQPFLVMSADGFLAGNMDREIPWSAVSDYTISTGYLVELAIDLVNGYTPPASKGDRRLRFKPKQQRLHIGVRGVAQPYDIEGLAAAFHAHWQGALARAALSEMEPGE